MICPDCHRTIREEQPYLMSSDPDRPGLLACLSGQAGEAWRLFVTVAVCVLAVLVITGVSAAVRASGESSSSSPRAGSGWPSHAGSVARDRGLGSTGDRAAKEPRPVPARRCDRRSPVPPRISLQPQ
jgi:hypothetical protein